MGRTFRQVIASRELSRTASDEPVLIEIGVPRRRKVGEWACPYRIQGLGKRGTRYAFGIDSVQALQVVQQAIWADLQPYSQQLAWLGQQGFTGFFRFYPAHVLGLDNASRVEAAIDREIHKEYLALKRRAERRQAAGKRRPSQRRAAT